MELEVYERKDYDKVLARVKEKHGQDYELKRWTASFSGWWYDDSNLEGRGDTPEESISDALNQIKEMQREIGNFLKTRP